jgi:hypothetical protein
VVAVDAQLLQTVPNLKTIASEKGGGSFSRLSRTAFMATITDDFDPQCAAASQQN